MLHFLRDLQQSNEEWKRALEKQRGRRIHTARRDPLSSTVISPGCQDILLMQHGVGPMRLTGHNTATDTAGRYGHFGKFAVEQRVTGDLKKTENEDALGFGE